MSIRLQVVMDEVELDAIRAAAREQNMTVSEWVRNALRKARQTAPAGDVDRKLAAVRAADRHAYPTGDIDLILAEIERGYGEGGE